MYTIHCNISDNAGESAGDGVFSEKIRRSITDGGGR